MVKLHKEIIGKSLQARIIMQVHDELVLEVLNDDVSETTELTEEIMSNVARLDINLKVDIGVGDNWEQAH